MQCSNQILKCSILSKDHILQVLWIQICPNVADLTPFLLNNLTVCWLKLHRYRVIHLWRPQENRDFLPPPLVHMRLTLVDVHTQSTWDTHSSLETASTILLPSGPKAEIRLKYQCILLETILLVAYNKSLYWWKISTFYSSLETKFWSKKANFFAWEEDRMTSVGSNPPPCGRHKWMAPIAVECCWTPMGWNIVDDYSEII